MIAQHYKDMLGAKSVIRQISEWSTARAHRSATKMYLTTRWAIPRCPARRSSPPRARICCKAPTPVTLHGYTPTLTLPSARKAVAESLNQRFGMDYTADYIFMTSGAAGALAHALRCVAVPGQNIVTLRRSPRI